MERYYNKIGNGDNKIEYCCNKKVFRLNKIGTRYNKMEYY